MQKLRFLEPETPPKGYCAITTEIHGSLHFAELSKVIPGFKEFLKKWLSHEEKLQLIVFEKNAF